MVVVACLGLLPPTNPVLLEVAEQQEEVYSVQPQAPRNPRAVVGYSARRRTISRVLLAQEGVCLAQHRTLNSRLPVEEDSSVRRKTSSLRPEVEDCLALVHNRVVEQDLEEDCLGLRLRRTNSPLQAVDYLDPPQHRTNLQVVACLGLRRRRISHQAVVFSGEDNNSSNSRRPAAACLDRRLDNSRNHKGVSLVVDWDSSSNNNRPPAGVVYSGDWELAHSNSNLNNNSSNRVCSGVRNSRDSNSLNWARVQRSRGLVFGLRVVLLQEVCATQDYLTNWDSFELTWL